METGPGGRRHLLQGGRGNARFRVSRPTRRPARGLCPPRRPGAPPPPLSKRTAVPPPRTPNRKKADVRLGRADAPSRSLLSFRRLRQDWRRLQTRAPILRRVAVLHISLNKRRVRSRLPIFHRRLSTKLLLKQLRRTEWTRFRIESPSPPRRYLSSPQFYPYKRPESIQCQPYSKSDGTALALIYPSVASTLRVDTVSLRTGVTPLLPCGRFRRRPALEDTMPWTKERLEEVARTRLGNAKLVVVANREPYIHFHDGEELRCSRPASGVTTALDPVLQACRGIWVAHGSGDGDREASDEHGRTAVPPENPTYTLRRVWLTRRRSRAITTASPTTRCGRCATSPALPRVSTPPTGNITAASIVSLPTPFSKRWTDGRPWSSCKITISLFCRECSVRRGRTSSSSTFGTFPGPTAKSSVSVRGRKRSSTAFSAMTFWPFTFSITA